MNRLSFSVVSLIGMLTFALAGCERLSRGSVQGAGVEAEELDPVVVTVFTAKTELFMEYPHLVKGQEARFLAHFTVLATGEPVRAGTLTLRGSGPGGHPFAVRVDAPKRDCLFIPEVTFDTPGVYEARLVLVRPQIEDTIQLGQLVVHADSRAAQQAAEQAAGHDPPGAIPFLMEQQWKINLMMEQVSRRTLIRRLQIAGEIAAPQDASAVVSSPISGRLLRPPSGSLPRIGDQVEAGQLLALVEPPLTVTTELALRTLDLATKALEADRAITQGQARLVFSKKEYERSKILKAKGVGSDRQYDQVEQNLKLAQAELDNASAAKAHYNRALQKLIDLRAGMQKLAGGEGETTALFDLPLRAPIAGRIVSANYVEGEHLEELAEIYRIVNLDRVLIVAHIPEFDLAEVEQVPSATMTLPAYPGRKFEVLGPGDGRLLSIGTVVDPQSRTVAIRYEMPNPEGLLRAGMFADVFLETKEARDCIAIPEESILMDNGRPICFVLIGGETFARRELELGVRDGGFVEVKGGVENGERVVVSGAYLIKLAALSPESFSHGHAH